jgi:GTP-binding protein HflX
MYTVYDTLRQLDIQEKPVLTAFNKIDRVSEHEVIRDFHADKTLYISARTGEGLQELLDEIESILRGNKMELVRVFPYAEAGKIQQIRKYGELLEEEYREDGIYVHAYVPTELYLSLG